MRTIHNLIESDKARKENGEAGFSLIELIIVVVILGILAAIAIPIFLNIQNDAKDNSLKTVTANAASQAAAALAQNKTNVADNTATPDADEFNFKNLISDTGLTSLKLVLTPATGATTDKFCVTGTSDDTDNTKTGFKSGPGC